jgi:hypothetical protein
MGEFGENDRLLAVCLSISIESKLEWELIVISYY